MMSRPTASAAGMRDPVAMSALSANTASIDGSASSFAWISAWLLDRSARPAESCRFSTLPKVSCGAVAALLEADVVGLLDRAEDLGGPELL